MAVEGFGPVIAGGFEGFGPNIVTPVTSSRLEAFGPNILPGGLEGFGPSFVQNPNTPDAFTVVYSKIDGITIASSVRRSF